ncbi:MAG: hypothetical protein U0L49_09765 [Eubacterium sp.]|nr:hypothetical protein [Eubacterium sp.]
MTTVYLCQSRTAAKPLYIDDLDFNIRTIEELCYLIRSYVPILDEDFFGKRLTKWLARELQMHRLARTLEIIRGKDENDVESMALAVLSEIRYLDAAEQEELSREIRGFRSLPYPARRKARADVLARSRKYMRALDIYKEILRMESDSHLGAQFTGAVYHNMGAAYAGMFQMDEACSCFKNAYSCLQTQKALRDYLAGIYLKDGEEAYTRTADDMGLDKSLRSEFEASLGGLKPATRPADLSRQLDSWVSEYHKDTRN